MIYDCEKKLLMITKAARSFVIRFSRSVVDLWLINLVSPIIEQLYKWLIIQFLEPDIFNNSIS